MQPQVDLPETPVDELIAQILSSRRITRTDQERFMSILLSKTSLTDKEHTQINLVFDALRNGRIRVVD